MLSGNIVTLTGTNTLGLLYFTYDIDIGFAMDFCDAVGIGSAMAFAKDIIDFVKRPPVLQFVKCVGVGAGAGIGDFINTTFALLIKGSEATAEIEEATAEIEEATAEIGSEDATAEIGSEEAIAETGLEGRGATETGAGTTAITFTITFV